MSTRSHLASKNCAAQTPTGGLGQCDIQQLCGRVGSRSRGSVPDRFAGQVEVRPSWSTHRASRFPRRFQYWLVSGVTSIWHSRLDRIRFRPASRNCAATDGSRALCSAPDRIEGPMAHSAYPPRARAAGGKAKLVRRIAPHTVHDGCETGSFLD